MVERKASFKNRVFFQSEPLFPGCSKKTALPVTMENTAKICLSSQNFQQAGRSSCLQRGILNLFKHLRWSFRRKQLTTENC